MSSSISDLAWSTKLDVMLMGDCVGGGVTGAIVGGGVTGDFVGGFFSGAALVVEGPPLQKFW
jgi:hypothetical protein